VIRSIRTENVSIESGPSVVVRVGEQVLDLTEAQWKELALLVHRFVSIETMGPEIT
jgi:hypothetical protein